jgi:hypothetical protein
VNALDAAHIGACVLEPANGSAGESDACETARCAEQEAFENALADETRASAAESGANCQLLTPGGDAGYEQAGDIEAGDEEYASGGGEKDVERSLVFLNRVVEERETVRNTADGRTGVLGFDVFLNCIQMTEKLR